MRIFVCKSRLHFPDSKHFRGFVGREIFENFCRPGLHPSSPQLYMLATALDGLSAFERLDKTIPASVKAGLQSILRMCGLCLRFLFWF